jgi:hypothetical protein
MEDDIVVACHLCEKEIDPYEEPVYVWSVDKHGYRQIFVCEPCDSEHRRRY